MKLKYNDWLKYLEKAKDKVEGRPLSGQATRVRLDSNNDICIRYHHTDVVIFHPDGTFTLDTSVWGSRTTIARLNQFAPVGFHFSRSKYVLYVSTLKGMTKFINGMRFNEQGELLDSYEYQEAI